MNLLSKSLSLVLAFVVAFTGPVSAQVWEPGSERWEYNEGPNPDTPEGKTLVDLYAEQPEYMLLSEALMEDQKFRYIFGLMMTRAYFERNAVKIFFIGQDATHIAEASKQPGTSGFGGRVQSIGNFFGVDQGIATTNAFLSTIKGQYGAFDHIFIEKDKNGNNQIRQAPFVDSELWMLANGEDSEIRIKREAFWEWMIKNNPEALQLVLTFGGAARDAWAEFLIKRGAKVPTKLNPERLKYIQVPETTLVYAGGNNEFPVPITKDGKDIYEILLREKHEALVKAGKARGPFRPPNYSKAQDQQAAVKVLREAGQHAIDMMVFTGGGLHGSGIVNAAQLGGYDLGKVEINGEITKSIRGLVLSDGYVVRHDIAFGASTHPSSLSKMTPKAASESLRKAFSGFLKLKNERGWMVRPDIGSDGKPLRNRWHEGEDYVYDRADIRAGYFEFGAPDDRRVSRADASRLDAQSIVAGARKGAKFDRSAIEAAKKALPSEEKNPNDLWSVRPRQKDTRYIFDRGPGKEIAKLILTHIDRDLLFEPKPEMKVINEKGHDITFETHGIDAYYTKTHPGTGLFGFHRGSFSDSRVLILADPHGIDDWITSRALTGARGQYLNGLMRDLGFGEDYLTLKTVPVGMDGATADEWEVVRQRTEAYREVMIRKALENGKIETIFTDGPVAKAEMKRILSKLGVKGMTVVNIQRKGMDPSSGILEAGETAKRYIRSLGNAKISGQMEDIPRSHLTWWSRIWEGTSGDRVIDATGKMRGGVRALVTPDWVVRQKVQPSSGVLNSIRLIKEKLENMGIRVENEPIQRFLSRRKLGDGRIEWKKSSEPIEIRNSKSAQKTQSGPAASCRFLFKLASGF